MRQNGKRCRKRVVVLLIGTAAGLERVQQLHYHLSMAKDNKFHGGEPVQAAVQVELKMIEMDKRIDI